MNIACLVLIPIILLSAATALVISHVHMWRAFQREDLDAKEFDYRRRQFRRRMQTSVMLGGLAVATFVGYWLTIWSQSRVFAVVFWSTVLLVLCWVVLLAVVDMVATRLHYGRLRQNYFIEQVKLEAELRRIKALQGNGRAGKTYHGDTEGAGKE